MKEIILPFNSQEYLYILFPDTLHQCAELSIQFVSPQLQLLLFDEYNYDTMTVFIEHLKKALQGLLTLHPSITHDIGYMWNQDIHKIAIEDPVQEEWLGDQYMLWNPPGTTKPKTTTWLYNNRRGDIIFEITPSYYWHFLDIQEYPDDEYITYEQFMKTYKPYVIKTLSHTLVQQWLDILSPLPAQIAEFTAIWNREHSNCDCPERKEMEEEREQEKQALEKKNQEYQ